MPTAVTVEESRHITAAPADWRESLDPPDRSRLAQQHRRALLRACRVAQLAEDFRGKETVVMDLTAVTPILDYFVITTGTNPRQMRSLIEEVRQSIKASGEKLHSPEGDDHSGWILQDYGDIVLHVFTAEARELYDLERLWGDAPQIDWKSTLAESEQPS